MSGVIILSGLESFEALLILLPLILLLTVVEAIHELEDHNCCHRKEKQQKGDSNEDESNITPESGVFLLI